jgi:ABC-2 type transport system permease protein
MNGSVVRHLMVKDWRLNRAMILFSIIGGAVAMAVVQHGGEGPMVVGSVWFFISLILIGTMLPLGSIMNERKKQNLPFLMSLPISSMQYTTSKMLSTVGMYIVPWLILVIGGIALIETRNIAPHGVIPILVILALMPFVGLAVMTCAALVGETEGWGIAANVTCNSSYGLTWYFMTRIPGLMVTAKAPEPVWNSTVLTALGIELGSIVVLLGLTYYLQSRKRDFI